MSDKELNIKSSTVEKGLDLIKDFLDKLISPSITEFGQLLADNVKFLRGKNQIKILQKAEAYTKKNNIDVKHIPIKILVPFLENASLEEDEKLQDKWSILLANMADSKINLQNQIFPYILSQISIEEFEGLKQLKGFENNFEQMQIELDELINRIQSYPLYKRIPEERKISEREREIENVKRQGFHLTLHEYEVANLFRLGLIRQLPPPIFIQEFYTGGIEPNQKQWHTLKAEYDTDDFGYRITELGEIFLKMCQEQQ